mgnify:CR=1 FL=1
MSRSVCSDPTLQSGKKLPRWQPRSRRGAFLGLSSIHSSEVLLVLNLQTGSITTHYHVVLDDSFFTVVSIGKDEDPPEYWDDLCLENTTYIPNDSNTETPMHLQDNWLTSDEQAQKQRELHRQ